MRYQSKETIISKWFFIISNWVFSKVLYFMCVTLLGPTFVCNAFWVNSFDMEIYTSLYIFFYCPPQLTNRQYHLQPWNDTVGSDIWHKSQSREWPYNYWLIRKTDGLAQLFEIRFSHPQHCKDSIPYSQFLWIGRICS